MRVWEDGRVEVEVADGHADGGAGGEGVGFVDDRGGGVDAGEAAGDAGADAEAFGDDGGEVGEFLEILVGR